MAEQFWCVLSHVVNYLTKQKTYGKRVPHFSLQFLFDKFFAPINILRVTPERRTETRDVSAIAVRF
jgi:hypothetical protein